MRKSSDDSERSFISWGLTPRSSSYKQHPPRLSHWKIIHNAGDKFDRSLIYTSALCIMICIITVHWWYVRHKHWAGSPHRLSSLYCVRLWAIQPSENGIIYSLSTSGMLAPLSLTTAGQFTLVPLTPSSVTAVFKSKSIYKYITDKKMSCSYAAGVGDVEHFSCDPGLRDQPLLLGLYLFT